MGGRIGRWRLEHEGFDDPARRRRVVIADDDEMFRHLLSWALRADGYEVLEARDGTELADILGSTVLRQGAEPIDLILTDVRMPGWSGIQVVASLRKMDWAIPVIVVTGHRDAEAEREAHRLGATLFLKPCELSELLDAVNAAVSPEGGGMGPRGQSKSAAASV